MRIVDKIINILPPESMRSGAIEYGSAPESFHGNTLYDYEIKNWKVLCIQPDRECSEELRMYRRFVLNLDCSADSGDSLDSVLSRINIEDIKILLVKKTRNPLSVIKTLSLGERNTEIVCVEQDPGDSLIVTEYLEKHGFRFLERVIVSDIYIRDEQKSNVQNSFENIFEV